MNKHDYVLDIFRKYVRKVDSAEDIEKELWETSFDKENMHYVYSNSLVSLPVISMDDIAQRAYRKDKYPESNKEEESIASVDACLITNDEEWFLIEFKNQKVSNSSNSVNKKAFQNWHMIMDICYMEKTVGKKVVPELYENPIEYAKSHVSYILVFESSKDPKSTERMIEAHKAKMNYVPESMVKLSKYLYKDAYALTSNELEKRVIKKAMEDRHEK